MSKNKLAIYISLLFTFGMFLQSCNSKVAENNPLPKYPNFTDQNPDLVDTSWLTDKPCSAPCWYGLQLGKSSMTNAIATVKELPFANPGSMKLIEIKLPQKVIQAILLECKMKSGATCIDMRFNNNVLENLYIWPNYQITFEQAVKKLGEPDGFIYSKLGAETNGCDISLVWGTRQMTLDFTEKMHKSGKDLCDRLSYANWKVPKGILVQTISYMLPKQIESLKSNDTYMVWSGFEE